MKRKKIEALAPKPKSSRKKKDAIITTQILEDTLILNFWEKNDLTRYCIRETGEYESLSEGIWRQTKIINLVGYGWNTKRRNQVVFDTKSDEKEAENWIQGFHAGNSLWYGIDRMECDWSWSYAERKEMRRLSRIEDTMLQIPPRPDDLTDWTLDRIGRPDYAIYDKENENYGLTCCERARKLKNNPKHLAKVTCPLCKKELTVLKRKTETRHEEKVLVLQNTPIGGVMRYFRIAFLYQKKRRYVGIEETIRILLHPDYRKYPVYWNNGGRWDNRHNWGKCRDYNYSTWLYGDKIEEALKETKWQQYARALAGIQGHRAYIDAWMQKEEEPNVLEYLAKGRFYKLLEEATPYCGLNREGETIEEVFRIKDRQKINRIRDRNGGIRMLLWMQWADRCRKKLSDCFLTWTEREHVQPSEGRWLFLKLSPEAAMHYIERQKKEAYKGCSTHAVINQYEDYMGMCQKLDKDLADEMIIRPKELKRRHDEAVKELEFRKAELDAAEYSSRFPEAEKVLSEVRDNLEYKGQQYEIKVPERIIDIVTEGRYLHHCAGATDRYFDRIASHETYIVFLRKVQEPDIPYYTVEVEPGGTIRQHRGMFDEEPDIEQVKPFLREWQKEIKKRMRAKDKERAKISAIKREENIKDLKARNNTRVLQGLMEDFMEAM